MLNWDFDAVLGGMRVGDSFFIPCLNCRSPRTQIRHAAKAFGIQVKIKERTEDYIRGLRIWRIG